MSNAKTFSASTVLIDEGLITIDELQGMLAEDIDALKRIALRYNGTRAELSRAADLLADGAIDHPVDDEAVHSLASRAELIAANTSQLVVQMRDFFEELVDHVPEPEDDAATIDAPADDDGAR